MSGTYLQHLGLIAIAAVISGVVSLTLGAHWGWALFSAALLAMLVYQLRQLSLLHRWVAAKGNEPIPESSGIWDEIFAKMYRRNRDQIRARGRFARLLARSMQAGRALPYGVAILDRDWRIVWCNDAAEAHFSVSMSADVGQVITNLVRQPEFLQYVNAGAYDEPMELNTARRDGLVLAIQMVPFVEAHHLLLSRDVTEAHKLSVMRRDFVANVSHELRTPLTVLVGFLETVRELKLDAERSRDYLALMSEQGHRMQSIIDDLLTLSTLESAPPPQSEEVVDIAALLAQVRNEAEQLSAGRHRISLVADSDYNLTGNTGEITSAFTNLANNAVRYTPVGGEITIRWSANPEGAQFCVIDNGPGIEAEHIPRLTERFYRVDRSRSRETGGTGLGLAIVKHALARHQATLDIESAIGKGSRFTARFPASRLVEKKSENVALA
jgi:two-component system phosphate regulon sensor histidine kinase PhoR